MDVSRKQAHMSSKVASYVLEELEDQLNFSKPMDIANIVSGGAEVKNNEQEGKPVALAP